MTLDAVGMKFIYGQRHAGIVSVAADASGFTKNRRKSKVSERWISIIIIIMLSEGFSSSSEPSSSSLAFLLARPILSFLFLDDASHAACHV